MESQAFQGPEISLRRIRSDLIEPDPNQPRKNFDEDEIKKLGESFNVPGVGNLQLVVVKPHPQKEGYYMLIAGERRWRAHKRNGNKEMWCILRHDVGDTFLASLAENANRIDLNPMEEADAVRRLRSNEYNMTWQEIEKLMGRSVPTLVSSLSLLDLPSEIQKMIIEGKLSRSNALKLVPYVKKGVSRKKLIESAKSLSAKKGVPELEVKRTTGRGEKITEQRVPTSPQGQLMRILKTVGKTTSIRATLLRFSALSGESQRRLFNRSLSARTRKEFLAQVTGLVEVFANFVRSVDDSGDFKATIEALGISSGHDEEENRKKSEVKIELVEDVSKLFDYLLDKMVLRRKEVLSIQLLIATLGTKERVIAAFRFLAESWQRPLSVFDPFEEELLEKIANFRQESGFSLFLDFFGSLRRIDCSKDPITREMIFGNEIVATR